MAKKKRGCLRTALIALTLVIVVPVAIVVSSYAVNRINDFQRLRRYPVYAAIGKEDHSRLKQLLIEDPDAINRTISSDEKPGFFELIYETFFSVPDNIVVDYAWRTGPTTPLFVAIHEHNWEAVEILLNHDATLTQDNIRYLTLYASDTLLHFLQRGVIPADFSAADSEESILTTVAAQSYPNEALLRHLLESDSVDIDHLGDDGKTALIRAAKDNNEKTVALLLEAGASETITDAEGRTYADYLEPTVAAEEAQSPSEQPSTPSPPEIIATSGNRYWKIVGRHTSNSGTIMDEIWYDAVRDEIVTWVEQGGGMSSEMENWSRDGDFTDDTILQIRNENGLMQFAFYHGGRLAVRINMPAYGINDTVQGRWEVTEKTGRSPL